MAEDMVIYENRLASFQVGAAGGKRRASSAGGAKAPKPLAWPHKSLSPADFAKAGFCFKPSPSEPDNVECFLCGKSLCGWEEGDDPLKEHLTHVPDCGFAVVAAVKAELGDYATVHPLEPGMIEARKATFAGRWPYESKRGWKCKTKQLAEAGWIYTPTADSDDMATCAYCDLALDGWEAGDKPMDEHYKRFAECLFFELLAKGPPPKKVRGKAARATNMSRLSMQSVATTFSEAQTVADETANHDDSVMTTASVMTQGGTKKAARGRKPAAAKTRKAKAKKEEPVEILEDGQDGDVPPPPPPKPARGRKRASDAVEDPDVTKAEAPAPKKRATRKASEVIADNTVTATSEEAQMEDAPAPPPKQPAGRKKGRASATKATTLKTSVSSLKSKASTASLRAQAEEHDREIERQLQVDVERPLADEEYLTADTEAERERAAPAPARGKKTAAARKAAQSQEEKRSEDYAMFDPAPVHNDEDADVSAELRALEAEMKAEPEPEQLQVPKKGRKAAGTRKVSKQTKKAKEAARPRQSTAEDDVDELSMAIPDEAGPETIEDHDASSATVITKTAPARTSTGRPRGRPKKSSMGPQPVVDEPQPARKPVAEPEPEVEDDDEPNFVVLHDISKPEAEEQENDLPEEPSLSLQSPDAATSPPTQSHSPIRTNKSLPPVPPPSSPPRAQDEQQPPPTTPRPVARRPIPPTHSAKQATISPTPSPQSSDAENQPPSSSTAPPPTAKRPPLPAVSLPPAATPQRNPLSPSRRNIIGGIQSAQPWKPVDLDVAFALVGQTEGDGAEGDVERLLTKGGGELSTPEKNMTVEEWVFYNAGLAEEMLRRECEGMVGVFEREGRRAMGVLEGLVVE